MAALIQAKNARQVWLQCAEHLVRNGSKTSPRGQETREDLDVTMIIEDPTDALLSGIGRKMNTALASLEALQLIGGICDPALVVKVAPNYRQFIDGGQFHGAYGPRTASQIPVAIDRLRADPDSRQAIVTLWDPLHDLFISGRRDYPCTLSFQFLIREGKLIMCTKMRSSDLWWGLTYDFFQFAQLQLAVAASLGIEVGKYQHVSTSMHFYMRDIEAITDVLTHSHADVPHLVPGIGNPDGEPWANIAERARRLMYGEYVEGFSGVQWHANQALKWRT